MAVTAAVAAVLSVGLGVQQGQQSKQAQRRSLRLKQSGQEEAERRAIGEQRRSEQDQRRLNRKRPNLQSLLAGERGGSRGGAASTLLTGARGGGRQLTLGRASLLGGS